MKSVMVQKNLQNDNRMNDDQVTHLQTKAQVEFFQQALDELGASSPEQAARIWAKAEQTRNGVYHYAVACGDLKRKIINEWGVPRESFWIIGASSPWLDRYEILSDKKVKSSRHDVRIKYFWATSSGPFESTENTLVIVKNKDVWCVKEVK